MRQPGGEPLGVLPVGYTSVSISFVLASLMLSVLCLCPDMRVPVGLIVHRPPSTFEHLPFNVAPCWFGLQ